MHTIRSSKLMAMSSQTALSLTMAGFGGEDDVGRDCH